MIQALIIYLILVKIYAVVLQEVLCYNMVKMKYKNKEQTILKKENLLLLKNLMKKILLVVNNNQ